MTPFVTKMSSSKLTFHAFLCTSLDGFIAREDGTVNFPNDALVGKKLPEGEDCGITDFMASLDAILMGRTTYEQALSFKRDGQGWQYGDTPLFVLSTTLERLPEGSPESVRLLKPHGKNGTSGRSAARIAQVLDKCLGPNGGHPRKIYVDGGQVVRQFIQDEDLDEITVTIVPILIGSGIRLFGPLEEDVKLDILEVKQWDVGFAQIKYKLRYGPEH